MLRVCGLLRFQGCGLREFRVLQGLIFVCGFQVLLAFWGAKKAGSLGMQHSCEKLALCLWPLKHLSPTLIAFRILL